MKKTVFLSVLFPIIASAQSNYEINSDKSTLYVIIWLIGFIISVFLIRAIFSIGDFINYQKAQVNLLSKIARKHGVSESDIDGILKAVNLKEYKS